MPSEEDQNPHQDDTGPGHPPWKVVIVDDDPDMQLLTRSLLRKLTFEGRSIQALSAHSGDEGVLLLREHPDTAVVLMDVMMEHDQAGLEAVRRIRQELNNWFVRIVLRT
ncbi:MAG: response regulator, partial [Magnetococcales bacterium]|nr:response regulator [Magnetococcales bacterium]